ncbi:CoA transferase [Frankia sp. AgKG'84/4]|uniref:CoA transferase n=1 Tax=Frankia sp. AgKG'84/4 TaxID=573490 RepID=UPI00200CAFD1|nr:CoA transferase [Frankia sp. AgKG'84/4]MCL9794257.1 CoA transferase [Frankia sp. AgKG'84/4]
MSVDPPDGEPGTIIPGAPAYRPTPGPGVAEQLALLVGEPGVAARLTVTGPADVLPSLYRVTTLAATSVAAAAVGAGRLSAARAGANAGGDGDGFGDRDTDVPVTVDTRHAAAVFRSERHLRIDGRPPPSPWDPVSGYYRTADDRWIQLHCNFPHHRDGVLTLLGVPNDPEAVARAIRRLDAPSLEADLRAAGMCAAMARPERAWAAHEQARALDGLPLVEITRLGETEAEPLPPVRAMAAGPAAGLRVLDLTRVIAGPVAGRTLAAYGADVLRIGAAHLPEMGSLLADTGFGKRNARLDLRVAADAHRLRELISTADVVLQAYRPGALDRLGFGPAAVTRLRPGIVYASISAYGRRGPWCGLRGFDSLVQTASGLALGAAAATGSVRPVPLPAQALDHATGYLAAYGVLDALARRAREGGGWHVQVSLARTGRWLQSLGRHDTLALGDQTADDVAEYRGVLPGDFGELSYIRPAATVAGVAPYWRRPPARPNSSQPSW